MKKLDWLLKGKRPIVLAPMAGITNLPFRVLCRRYGADAAVTEMVCATAVVRKKLGMSAKEECQTLKLIRTSDEDRPIGLQLFGNDAGVMAEAAERLQHDFDWIDINMGCSVDKMIRQKAGVHLMKEPELAAKVISKMTDSIDVPLTVKIRSGFRKVNAVDIAKMAEENGAAAVAVHPRTARQGFSGVSDWDVIRQVKEAVGIPVIGNGDVINAKRAEEIFASTGCDAVMIGRAAIGNPFIFRQVREFLDRGNIVSQKPEEKIADFFSYMELCRRYDLLELNDVRQKAMWFTKGIAGSARTRQDIVRAGSIEEIEKILGLNSNL